MTFDIFSDKDLVLVKIVPYHDHIILRRIGESNNIVMEIGDVIKMEKKK